MRALGSRILIRPKVRETVRASGLVVPVTSDERAQEGEIISVGPKVRSGLLQEGRMVYFGKFSIDATKDQEIVCLREVDVLAVIVDGKVQPLGRMMVEMIPIGDDYRRNMGPTLVKMGIVIEDKKKHWEHEYRRGVVVSFDPRLKTDVCEGDVVIFQGAMGFTLDGDVMDEDDKYDAPLKGEGFRWLKPKEVDAVDEIETEIRRAARANPIMDFSMEMDPLRTENPGLLAKFPSSLF